MYGRRQTQREENHIKTQKKDDDSYQTDASSLSFPYIETHSHHQPYQVFFFRLIYHNTTPNKNEKADMKTSNHGSTEKDNGAVNPESTKGQSWSVSGVQVIDSPSS
jgi:hypothetical protein